MKIYIYVNKDGGVAGHIVLTMSDDVVLHVVVEEDRGQLSVPGVLSGTRRWVGIYRQRICGVGELHRIRPRVYVGNVVMGPDGLERLEYLVDERFSGFVFRAERGSQEVA